MAQLLLANPIRKRRTSKKRKSPARRRVARRASPISRVVRRRRYRRNPIGGGSVNAVNIAKAGAIGGAGAFAVDVVMAKIPQLSTLGGTQMQPLIKGAVGVAIGMAVAKFGKNKALGVALAEGAVTVQLHSLLKAHLGKTMGLSAYEDDLDFEVSGFGDISFDDIDDDMSVSGELLAFEDENSDFDMSGDLLGLSAYTNAAPIMNGMGAYTDHQ